MNQSEVAKKDIKEETLQISTIQVDTKKLDDLMNLSGELVTVRAQFERLVDLFSEEISSQKEETRLLAVLKSGYISFTKEIKSLLNNQDEKEQNKILKIIEQFNDNFVLLEKKASQNTLLNQVHSLDETTGSLGKVASDIQIGVMQTRDPKEGSLANFRQIIQALLVNINDEVYAFPLEFVTEIIKVNKEEVYSIDGNDTVKLRDHTLSLVELEKVIKVKRIERDEILTKRVVVISDGERQVGVVVDSLVGETEIVIKSLSSHFNKVKGVSGATILGDGQIALILDPIAIILEA